MTNDSSSLPPGFTDELSQLIASIESLRTTLTTEETLTTEQQVTARRRLFLMLHPLKTIRWQLAGSESPTSQSDREVTWNGYEEAFSHIEQRLERLLREFSLEQVDASSEEYKIEQTLGAVQEHLVILRDALLEMSTESATLPEQLPSRQSLYAGVAGRKVGDGRWLEYQLHRALRRWGYQAATRQTLFNLEVDVVATRKTKQHKPSDWIVAQCKDWTSDTITPAKIFRLCTIAFACRAMPVLCHTTELTPRAEKLARHFEVRVLDLRDLERGALPAPQVYSLSAELNEWPPEYGVREDRGSLPLMFYREPGKRFSYVPGFTPMGMDYDYEPIDTDRDDDTHPAAGH
ncbi:restriction endonuclease [Halorubrum kocurii]|uniref:Restriction endonuclease type IV Mrr domain-containing protein n=1 Tax=Halorubrum kocurii JCM 14978 TaxID=1230456 RepID=M0PK52_9EURY|nr:restriction endonuclease [Halorubrum kocurii]EMA70412.1 hypothetical protein C468_00220 [Halorubrum kocurii JCM 14978]